MSVFRGTSTVHIFQKKVLLPLCSNLSSKIEKKIGGLMGFGGAICITEVAFDRNQYYPGDECRVKIMCDNSKCSVGVKSFKLKLKRKIFASGERISAVGQRVNESLKQSKYIYS